MVDLCFLLGLGFSGLPGISGFLWVLDFWGFDFMCFCICVLVVVVYTVLLSLFYGDYVVFLNCV